MGCKIWESLLCKFLLGWFNIVVMCQVGYIVESVQVVGDMGDVFDVVFIQVNIDWVDEVFVIGGVQIYVVVMIVVDCLYLIEVDVVFVGDVVFFDFLEKDWFEFGWEVYFVSEVDDYVFVFCVFECV